MRFFVLFSLIPLFASAANILVLNIVGGKSHHIWLKTLMYALSDRGHNITYLSMENDKEVKTNIHYLNLDKAKEFHDSFWTNLDIEFWNSHISTKFEQISLYDKQRSEAAIKSTGYRQLLEYPKNFKFDLTIYEFEGGPFLLNFAEKFGNSPIIGASSIATAMSAYLVDEANIVSPSLIKFSGITKVTEFWGRFLNYFTIFVSEAKKYYNPALAFVKLKKIFPNGTNPLDLEKKVKVILINKHPTSDDAVPLMPNVIPVGGLHIQPVKDLPPDLQKIMDTAEEGVILFSLGSSIQSVLLSKNRLTEIVETFRTLPKYTFLWKYENNSFPVALPSNVVIRQWLPQFDILAHPNLKLFISQCGQLSVQEAIWNGVPILGLPVYLDQNANIEHSVKAGYAEKGDLQNIDRHSFKKLIEKMMHDPKYKNKASTYSQIFKDQKDSPLERAVWWSEFVLRHPNMTFMESPYADISPFIRHSWDVLALTFIIFSLILYLIFKWFIFFMSNLFKKKTIKTKKE